MAKIKHNNFIDTVDKVLSNAKQEGVLHLYAEDNKLSGRTIQIKGKEMAHFGTTGYLGLEQDSRVKEAAITAIQDYGTQFPLSKSYISHPLYQELENKIEEMYGLPPIITKNSTLGHLAVIPTLIRDEDAVILDHQVHWSVQNSCQLLKLRGIPVEMIRHNNMNMLEEMIKILSSKANKIWYMADGVYSMYGDYAPMKELLQLTHKYSQLHLYFDDVHGTSWKGKNGTGFVFDNLPELTENCVVVGTLSKSFGASGATVFCKSQLLREKIKNFGGPLTFSAQLEPASVAAAIASANIHLSNEIVTKQTELQNKIEYFNHLLLERDLPMISINDSPVFFLGMATPETAFNFIQRLFKEGFFINLGIYPAVPIKNTGIRITLSSHNTIADIKALTEAMDYHFLKSVEETNNSRIKINQAFGIKNNNTQKQCNTMTSSLYINERNSVDEIDQSIWNDYMGSHNIFNCDGLKYLEKTFAKNKDKTNQFDFYYYTITDEKGKVVLLTFFTCGFWKDDMLATESVSIKMEEQRKKNPLYATSKVLSMGSLFTEGKHYFIDEQHPLAEEAWRLLLHTVEQKYNFLKADVLILRDFNEANQWDKIIRGQGYFTINMPESCIVTNIKWKTYEEFTATLSTRSRKHFMKEILPYEKLVNIAIKDKLTNEEMTTAYGLYKNVKDNNFAINTFTYTMETFTNMNDSTNWEFILLSVKTDKENSFTAVMFCFKNGKNTYTPALIGMNYNWTKEYHLYRQLLFQTIKRANELDIDTINFGFSAAFEKKKLGAVLLPKVAYIQTRDNFDMEAMQMLQNDY